MTQNVFDPRKLTEQQLGCVEYVLSSPAYIEVFEPYLKQYRDSLNALWLDRSEERKRMYPDDLLAGGVAAVDGLLKFFSLIIEETNLERIHAAVVHVTSDDIYTLRQQQGRVHPVVGIDQPVEPQPDPVAEDY